MSYPKIPQINNMDDVKRALNSIREYFKSLEAAEAPVSQKPPNVFSTGTTYITPDGTHKYKVAVDNSGNVTSTLVT